MLTNLLLCILSLAPPHCGGPCEVPRGADPVSADARYSLTRGPEKSDWRYLFDWIRTGNGEPKHRLEDSLRAPPLRDSGYRRLSQTPPTASGPAALRARRSSRAPRRPR